jgi:isocitrate/isopropylmalate dehydrogenase
VLRATCGLFRRVALETLAAEGVPADERHVDACALELAREPRRFDVILTSNLFGDVLSDLAAMHMGGLGAAPSGSYGEGFALFEPVHGSAPELAGRGAANPLAAFLSGAMLLEHLGFGAGGDALRRAARACAAEGFTTPDLGGTRRTGEVARRVEDLLAAAGAA